MQTPFKFDYLIDVDFRTVDFLVAPMRVARSTVVRVAIYRPKTSENFLHDFFIPILDGPGLVEVCPWQPSLGIRGQQDDCA